MIVTSMKFDDRYEHDPSDLARKLLQVLLPDDTKQDTEYQAGIRTEAEMITFVDESPEITKDEIWRALVSMGRRKATRYIYITIEVWIKVWPAARR